MRSARFKSTDFPRIWAVSSAAERFVYTEDVGGSIPSPPTTFIATKGCTNRSHDLLAHAALAAQLLDRLRPGRKTSGARANRFVVIRCAGSGEPWRSSPSVSPPPATSGEFRNFGGCPNAAWQVTGSEKFEDLYQMLEGNGPFKDVCQLRARRRRPTSSDCWSMIRGHAVRRPRRAGCRGRLLRRGTTPAPPCPSRRSDIILGARHDRLTDPNNSPFPYGHGSSMAKCGATS